MEYVVFYSTNQDKAALIPEIFPRHRAYLENFAAGGSLLAIGAFNDPLRNGSMAIFRDRESALRFVAGDPFVTEGAAVPGEIREWDALSFR